ncbi:MAG: hypothetical protein V1750_11195 [Acidobacteriota bacterium]
MAKKIVLGGVAVFVLWSLLDFVIHGIILRGAYEATAQLWRPMAEMKHGVMYVAVFIAALAFAAIYGLLVGAKSLGTGVKYGLIFGVGAGVAMGYGTYSVMPIPYSMAFTWFLGAVIEYTLGGCLVGLIIKE